MSTTVTGAEAVEWDLSDLFDGPDDPRLLGDLDEAAAAATAFRERYRGKLGELSAAELNDAVVELERLKGATTRVETYARLRLAADSSDQSRGALVQKVRERNTQIETELLFFDLEWAALDDEIAERLLADPALERYASVLRSERRYRPYLLSEPEEKISAEKSLTGASAWGRLFNELLSDLRIDLDGGQVSVDEALSRLSRLTQQDERRQVAEAVTDALRPGVRTRGYILNTILNERAIEDRLRGYSTWISARNLANEIPDEAADSLVEAIVPATTSRSATTRSRRGCSGCRGSRTTTASHRCRRCRGRSPGTTRASSCSSPSRTSRPPQATWSAASSSASGSTRPCGRGRCSARSAPPSCPTSTHTC